MRRILLLASLFVLAGDASAQIQVDLSFKRLQYVAYEPVIATVRVTNLSGRDLDLQNGGGQNWFGFEVTGAESRIIPPLQLQPEGPLHLKAGDTVTRKVDLSPRFSISELGTYHARANIYFADLNKFYYSPRKVFQVGDARAIWQRTVGVPEGQPDAGQTRTYSLLSNRFPDHTTLYVRVENKSTGVVYSTFPIGRIIISDDPQAELDRANQLHILHCATPRTWAYSRVGLNGQLLAHATFMETKTRPHLQHAADGAIAVTGGLLERPAPASSSTSPKLSDRPDLPPADE